DLVEEAVVAAGGLGAALDDVAGGDGAGEAIPVVALPGEAPRGRPHDQGGVGDAPGDDDVGAARERLGDAPAAQVGVGADHVDTLERQAAIEVQEALAGRLQRAQVRQEVVALDD